MRIGFMMPHDGERIAFARRVGFGCVELQAGPGDPFWPGNPGWRDGWSRARGEFGNYVVEQFGRSMKSLGSIYDGPGDEVLVHLPRKNVKLYHLAFFSKKPLGMKLWREARKYSDEQLSLFD